MITFGDFFIFNEAKEGDRVGISHLYSLNKPELYSMSYENFVLFVGHLADSNGIISKNNSTVSEKIDGMALKVGIDENGFFMQSSYSGKVYQAEEFLTKIKFPAARDAFIESFEKIQEIIEPLLNKQHGLIQLEWLYSPNATKAEKEGHITFMTAEYQKAKLGNWSTFIILNIQTEDKNLNQQIYKYLLTINDEEIKFLSPQVEIFQDINLYKEYTEARGILAQIEKLQLNQQITLLKGNRKRDAIRQRKQLEAQLREMILPIQKKMYEKIVENLLKTEGILGDIEGYVIKFGDLFFKVNNPHYMAAKFN